MGERIKKRPVTMEYYSALTEEEIRSLVTTWINLEGILLSEVSQAEMHAAR